MCIKSGPRRRGQNAAVSGGEDGAGFQSLRARWIDDEAVFSEAENHPLVCCPVIWNTGFRVGRLISVYYSAVKEWGDLPLRALRIKNQAAKSVCPLCFSGVQQKRRAQPCMNLCSWQFWQFGKEQLFASGWVVWSSPKCLVMAPCVWRFWMHQHGVPQELNGLRSSFCGNLWNIPLGNAMRLSLILLVSWMHVFSTRSLPGVLKDL